MLKKYKPRAIIHFAAESHVDKSISSPKIFFENNVLGFVNFIETVRDYWNNLDKHQKGKFRFLNVSTDEVFGSLNLNESPFKETSSI